MGSKV
ncbi:putative membrane protein, partial [Vibrio parahaemolyticus AQ3810]|jgi:hAT family C-terminal dimerisation region